jgi:hypothetical protein
MEGVAWWVNDRAGANVEGAGAEEVNGEMWLMGV